LFVCLLVYLDSMEGALAQEPQLGGVVGEAHQLLAVTRRDEHGRVHPSPAAALLRYYSALFQKSFLH
jgi:hypothetical protein